MAPFSTERTDQQSADESAYRFEVGGGHWLFGTDPVLLKEIQEMVAVSTYVRRAAVWIGSLKRSFPYPLQNHTQEIAAELGREISAGRPLNGGDGQPASTMARWLRDSFDPLLCELFFLPFNERYTAGLASVIAPQDAYKSPAPTSEPKQAVGYNQEFCYPEGGLDRLVAALADKCQVRYNAKISAIDVSNRLLIFEDGTETRYRTLVSTVPLDQALKLAGITVPDLPDPYTSVLVINIGAERGSACPDVHWQYEPDSDSGFHRIGFYSNVDRSFLPRQFQSDGGAVSLYVERAYRGGCKPDQATIDSYCASVVDELRGRGYIGEVHVLDPSWVDVAYTWRYAGSNWQAQAIKALSEAGIEQAGLYGTWHIQGIADSIRDGYRHGELLSAQQSSAQLLSLHR
jgi:protoporphyrinogen oxidase